MAAAAGEEALSSTTKQKVAATKQYIEKHYKSQMKSLQEHKERHWMLERKLADADVFEEEQNNILKDLEKRRQNTCAYEGIKWALMTLNCSPLLGEVRLGR
ncbi:hypothetical protein ZEAMMB73_Zm00001d044381 [Zea mays]|uniref:Uncharacterized protein n=1 Tax=Zea mays TaxID=4577 RepID=A0A1D6NLB5_MAIZE|nr:hypothetical protein ZEAMMB73_Zm00001d044381 [Zea mays]